MIKVKNITKSYGYEKNKVDVLKDISFSIKEGSFVAIMGTSGSGKTTLLNCISGIEDKLKNRISELSGGEQQRGAK